MVILWWRRYGSVALGFLGLLIWMVASAAPLQAQGNGQLPADLQALINEALQANREVKQMGYLKTAAREQVKPAGALDDPELAFAMKDVPVDTWSLNKDGQTQKMVEISQKFPFPGKRRLRQEVASAQAESEGFTYQDKVNEIRAKVVQSYWSLSLAYTGFDLTQKNKQFWEQVVQVAETRYGVGQGQQADVLQAQVELGAYLDRLLQWKQRQESAQADLNAIRSKSLYTSIPRPQALTTRPFNLKLPELLDLAEARPQVQALKQLIAKQELAVDLARKDYLPDFTISLYYGNREDLGPPNITRQPDMFTGRVMVNLPIWHGSKIKPKIREEEARAGAAREAHQGSLNTLQGLIRDRHAKLQRLAQQVSLYDKGIVPQSRQAAASALASYQVGAIPFSQLYQSQIAVFAAELQLQEYLKDFEENWAELEWLVGQELPRSAGGKK